VPDDAGVLTVEVLKYFTVTLDYAHRRVRMSLKARPLYTVTGAQFTIQPDEQGEWRVTNVKEKSPAQQAGVEKGDLLLSLAGTPCSKLSPGELDGLKWSKRRVVFVRGGEKDRREITVTWTEADEGPKDPLLLGLLREWTFPEGRDSVEIPVKLSGTMPMVEIKVNGQALRCVLDTGASTSLLSLEAADRAGLKKGPRRDGLSISNEQVTAFQAIAETVDIGGLTIRREPWGVTAFPEALTHGEGIDGLIGLGTIRDFVVRMDWKAKKVMLWKRGKEPPVEGGFTVPVKLEEWPVPPPATPAPQRFRPVACRMMLTLSGQTFPCTMDTGSSGGLRFPEELIREKLPAVAATAGPLLENGSGLSGVVMVRMIHLPEFTLGNETLKDLPAGVGRFQEGIVGMRMLRHFTITLDADGGRLHLLPYGTLSEFTSGSTLGMAPVLREGRMVVGTVIPGGPAEAAGIKAGDVIVSLDGQDVMEKKEKGKEDEKEQKPPPPGTAVKVKVIRQGVEMEYTVTTGKL
jgi:membrane-associated protease RseP (regulator of RpoE activity)